MMPLGGRPMSEDDNKTLFVVSCSAFLASVACLVAWYDYGVLIVHPVLSVVGIVASLGFGILSLSANRND